MSVNPKGIIEKVVLSLFFLLAGFNPGNTRTVLSISCFLLSLFRHKDSSHCSTLILKEKNLGPFGAHQVQKFWRFQINSTHEAFLLNWRSWLNLNIQQVGLQPFPERRKLGSIEAHKVQMKNKATYFKENLFLSTCLGSSSSGAAFM